MAESKSINPVAVAQAGISFTEIAGLAATVHRLLVDVVAKLSEPDEDAETPLVAARELANQIGLLADMGAVSLGSIEHKGAGAQAWLLPPVWHHVGKQTQEEARHV